MNGEDLAKSYLENTNDFKKLFSICEDFMVLSDIEKMKFLMFVAGTIQRHREDLTLK